MSDTAEMQALRRRAAKLGFLISMTDRYHKWYTLIDAKTNCVACHPTDVPIETISAWLTDFEREVTGDAQETEN